MMLGGARSYGKTMMYVLTVELMLIVTLHAPISGGMLMTVGLNSRLLPKTMKSSVATAF